MTTEELWLLCKQAGMTVPNTGWLRTSQAAQLLDRCEGTLENWRRRKIGPRAHHIGGTRWRYRIEDVAAYITATTGESKSVNQGQ